MCEMRATHLALEPMSVKHKNVCCGVTCEVCCSQNSKVDGFAANVGIGIVP